MLNVFVKVSFIVFGCWQFSFAAKPLDETQRNLANAFQNLHSWTDLLNLAQIKGGDREHVLQHLRSKEVMAPFPRMRYLNNTLRVDHERFELRIQDGLNFVFWRNRFAIYDSTLNTRQNFDSILGAFERNNSEKQSHLSFPLVLLKLALLQAPSNSEQAEAQFVNQAYAAAGTVGTIAVVGPAVPHSSSGSIIRVQANSPDQVIMSSVISIECHNGDGGGTFVSADFARPSSLVFLQAYEYCKTTRPAGTDCETEAPKTVANRESIDRALAWRLKLTGTGTLLRTTLGKKAQEYIEELWSQTSQSQTNQEIYNKLKIYCEKPDAPESRALETQRAQNAKRFENAIFETPAVKPPQGGPPPAKERTFSPPGQG